MSALLLSALAGLCTWGQQHLMVTVSQEDDVCSVVVSTGWLAHAAEGSDVSSA